MTGSQVRPSHSDDFKHPADPDAPRQDADHAPCGTPCRMDDEGPPNAGYAISVTPKDEGWAWELVNAEGETTARGFKARQEDALRSACRAARNDPGSTSRERPKPRPTAPRDLVDPNSA